MYVQLLQPRILGTNNMSSYISLYSSSMRIGVSPKLFKIEKPFSRKQYAEFSIASGNVEMEDDSTYVVSGMQIDP